MERSNRYWWLPEFLKICKLPEWCALNQYDCISCQPLKIIIEVPGEISYTLSNRKKRPMEYVRAIYLQTAIRHVFVIH